MTSQAIAPYVLKLLAQYQLDGKLCSLDQLVQEIQARRADVRRTVSALHREGYVDALHMRLTMAGFAIGRTLLRVPLPALRASRSCCAAA
jgi:DNA-binding IclR family transcriptional regulator